MGEQLWLLSDKPHIMLNHLRRLHARLKHPVNERKLRFFAYHGCRLAWTVMHDERSRAAVETGERALIGTCSEEQYTTAVEQARRACDEAYANANGPYVREIYNAAQGAGIALRAVLGADMDGCVAKIRDALAFAGLIGGKADLLALLANMAHALRDIFGNPFRPVVFDPAWRTDTAVSLARGMYDSRDFSAMPILADALQDAGCDSDDILDHCRDPLAAHVRGCWVVDLVLGKA